MKEFFHEIYNWDSFSLFQTLLKLQVKFSVIWPLQTQHFWSDKIEVFEINVWRVVYFSGIIYWIEKIGHEKNCFQFHMWSASLLHGDSNLSFSNIDIAEFWNEVEGLYQVIGSSADTCPYIWLLDNPAWSEESLIP